MQQRSKYSSWSISFLFQPREEITSWPTHRSWQVQSRSLSTRHVRFDLISEPQTSAENLIQIWGFEWRLLYLISSFLSQISNSDVIPFKFFPFSFSLTPYVRVWVVRVNNQNFKYYKWSNMSSISKCNQNIDIDRYNPKYQM